MTFAGEFLGLPGLRGYWPMNVFDSSGNAIDLSANGRTLTYNGGGTGPLYNFTTQGGPYIDLDGTGDFLSRADEAGLDITGTETYIATAVRGLTMGGWFWSDVAGSTQVLMSKDNNATQRSYSMTWTSANQIQFNVSNNGSTVTSVTGAGTLSTGTWYFVAGRFTPSTELAVFVNSTETTNTTSIPASIFNSTAVFNISGLNSGTLLLNGRASNCFLCVAALSDTAIDDIYQNTKASYGL